MVNETVTAFIQNNYLFGVATEMQPNICIKSRKL